MGAFGAMSVVMRQKAHRHGQKSESASEKHTTQTHVEDSCPICQETIGSRSPEGVVEGWSVLPCGHRFGSYCIKRYLRVVADDRPACPVCRQMTYHACGHPPLPALLKTNHGKDSTVVVEQPEAVVERLKFTKCSYCQRRGPGRQGRRLRRGVRRGWKEIPWMRVFSFRGKTHWLRSGTAAQHDGDGSASSRESLSQPTSPTRAGILAGAWHGAWIDPFPRARDPEWERWWDQQAPSGA
ncbi:hypothetical protein B0T19DRAFT_441824 [Cercophora scortea]|uniref:RING-type domain-containing protein n=1 Tax=Cercophora scortea TaxID=314031 RepID=A0AAE0IMZ1_9PEZI|nr:hypothetical protein B0T19DRAFT_441824 [Cercophora scortea]